MHTQILIEEHETYDLATLLANEIFNFPVFEETKVLNEEWFVPISVLASTRITYTYFVFGIYAESRPSFTAIDPSRSVVT